LLVIHSPGLRRTGGAIPPGSNLRPWRALAFGIATIPAGSATWRTQPPGRPVSFPREGENRLLPVIERGTHVRRNISGNTSASSQAGVPIHHHLVFFESPHPFSSNVIALAITLFDPIFRPSKPPGIPRVFFVCIPAFQATEGFRKSEKRFAPGKTKTYLPGKIYNPLSEGRFLKKWRRLMSSSTRRKGRTRNPQTFFRAAPKIEKRAMR